MPKAEELTADELLVELRRRERGGARSAVARPKGRTLSAARGAATPVPDIAKVPTATLTKLLKSRQRAIYGVDNRKDTFEVKDAAKRRLAAASVAFVEAKDLTSTAGGRFKLRTTSYREEFELCPNETFATQPLGCFCSGVLVAPDVVATAGHCVTKAQLSKIRVVFGFQMIGPKKARTEFAPDQVYKPVEIIGRKLTDTGPDWALIRLDRPVVGRKPVAIRRTGKIGNSDALFVIGHPSGLPQKIAGGAQVLNNTRKAYFAANLDTYGGNSGSPVFSAKTRKLEGLLSRGETDFVLSGNCYVSQVFPTTGAGGEDVTRTSEWQKLVKNK